MSASLSHSFLFLTLAIFLLNLSYQQVAADNTAQCHQYLEEIQKDAYPASTKMKLATGHGNYGFYYPNQTLLDPGHWDGCHFISDNIAHYCNLRVEVSEGTTTHSFTVGACVPSICQESELQAIQAANRNFLTSVYSLPPEFALNSTLRVDCSTATYDYPIMWYVTIGIVALLVVMSIIGTFVEILIVYNIGPMVLLRNKEFSVINNSDYSTIGEQSSLMEPFKGGSGKLQSSSSAPDNSKLFDLCSLSITKKNSNKLIQFLLCFSIPYNVNRLLSSPPPGNMEPLNGIRVIAMTFVVLGHTFYFLWDTMPQNNFLYLGDVMQTMRFQIVVAGFFAVDTFFWLSGFLVAYYFVKELKQYGIRLLTFPIFYFHRIYRLTPTLYMGLLFYWFITPYWANGPYWKVFQDVVLNSCNNNWWYTALYINNFVPMLNPGNGGLCMGWTWYLADDMQFFIFSPLILILYWKNQWLGWLVTVGLIVVCFLCNLIISLHLQIRMFPGMIMVSDPWDFTLGTHSNFAEYIYLPPWTRMAPYLIGFLCAFILLEKKEKFFISPLVRTLIYISSSLIVVILCFIPFTDSNYGWDEVMSTLFISFSRTMWSFGLGAFLLVAIVGYGGIVSEFLSASYWVPLARLSYGAYIYHLANITMVYSGNLNTFTYQFANVLYYFLGHLSIAYGYSLLNFMLLEKPLMNIESIFILRGAKA